MAFAQNRKWNYCHVTQQYVIYVSFSLTFLEVGCMGNFQINQKIKKIKVFDSFDSLINWDGVHTSYLNEGHCSTDKHFWMLIIMYTNGYNSIPVMAGLKKRKINKKIKKKSKSLILLIIWLFSRLCSFQTFCLCSL